MSGKGVAPACMTIAAMVAMILPGAAVAKTSDDMKAMQTILSSAKTLGMCQYIGFDIDQDALSGKVDSLMTRLVNSGVSDENLARASQQASADGDALAPVLTMPDVSKGNSREAFDQVETVFQHIQQRCEDLSRDPDLSPHIARGPYQGQAEPKSFFGLLVFQANEGDAGKMFILGNLYAAGVKPDPDHRLEFMWYKRAADRGYPIGTGRVAEAYFIGRGVDKDSVEAVKWSIICEALGGGSSGHESIEPQVSAAQRKMGEERVSDWLNTCVRTVE